VYGVTGRPYAPTTSVSLPHVDGTRFSPHIDAEWGRSRPWTPSAGLVAYIRGQYGCNIATYLEFVRVHYRADVSYVVEILDRANGRGPHRGKGGNYRKLSEEQTEEIIRRLWAGENHGDIAEHYGVSREAITAVKRRHGVAA
jgi:hypothetical protein